MNIQVKRTNRNGYSIKVIDEENILITCPKYYNDVDIKLLLNKHKRFINNRIKSKIESKTISDNIHILGKEYKVNKIYSDFNNIIVDDINNCINLYIKNDSYIKKTIYEYYKKVLENIVIKYDLKLKEAFNINFDVTYGYKDVKTYFGECNYKLHHIILALKLAKYDEIYILSVLCHEYAHFYVQNHSEKFYNVVEKAFKNYKKYQSELRKIKYKDLC